MKVSIALCTYNGEKYIKEQLTTILQQTRLPDEIVVSDDNSKDNTLAIVDELAKKTNVSIVINKNTPGLGVFKNFEKAISLCTGDIIFCCDQDDIWHLDKIEKFMPEFEDKDILLVYSNAAVVLNDSSHYLYPLWEKKDMMKEKRGTSSYSTLVYRGGSIAGCCMAFRKEFAFSIMPFPEKVYHDDWLATCAIIKGKIGRVDEELIDYRQHGNNVVGITRGSKLSYWKSLFTNIWPYVEHREYIYDRHLKVSKGLFGQSFLNENQKKEFEENLEFTSHRAMIRKQSYFSTFKFILSDAFKGYYSKYGKGVHEIFFDLYDLMIIMIFKKKRVGR